MKAPAVNIGKTFAKNIDLVKQWLHVATVYSVVDLGTQETLNFETKEKEYKRKIKISFEFPNIMSDFGKWKQPVSISFTKNLSMHPKSALRPAVETIIGKKMTDEEASNFQFENLLWKNVHILVKHNWEYCNISDFLVYEGDKIEVINNPYIFDLDNFDEKSWDRIYKDTQDKIKLSPEYIKISSKVEYWIEENTDLPF